MKGSTAYWGSKLNKLEAPRFTNLPIPTILLEPNSRRQVNTPEEMHPPCMHGIGIGLYIDHLQITSNNNYYAIPNSFHSV
jgi:hypothetical protein